MIRRPPRSTLSSSSAASDVYKRQEIYRASAGEAACKKSLVLSHVMDGFRAMTPTELECNFPEATGGWHYSSFMIEGSRYVPYLRDRAVALGLRIVESKVSGLSGSPEFCQSAVTVAERPSCRSIVNATGINGGPECYPVRGQLLLVKAPYVKVAMGEYNTKDQSYPTYIYPRRDHVVLGSTYLEHDGDKEVRQETTDDIIRRCAEFVPELKTAKIISEVVCIRPGRKAGVRLEAEEVEGGFRVVHNYGHGGAGMSLAWGCAGEVVSLVCGGAASKL
eukprot:TRINITY_DN16724_c0_g1_i2.p1 TRINITY_DN16724_c0_g1~~TRINITY_DN16724_c0_g1_i2.p1  ORF type:complete len:277 (-),score=63.68 TRINITY_DN16724_c0_g1_i2:115-945(-)